MEPEQKAAYVVSQSVSALIEAIAMMEENRWCETQGQSLAYGEGRFTDLIDKYAISHNAVLGLFNQ